MLPPTAIVQCDETPVSIDEMTDFLRQSRRDYAEICEVFDKLSGTLLSDISPENLRLLRSTRSDARALNGLFETIYFDGIYGPEGTQWLYKIHVRARDWLAYFVVSSAVDLDCNLKLLAFAHVDDAETKTIDLRQYINNTWQEI